MFCYCGTLLRYPSSDCLTICTNCGEQFNKTIFEPLITIKEYHEEIEIVVKKSKGAKIRYKCNNCGAEEMYYYTMQTRSADEGQTVFYECDCGYKEKINS
ncbi:hypothetical protein EDEG_01180 [Edhazardia aedis USNM 41457]|uniref:DNA-directed RNA polymerase I subunit RPA12 n=1 Tax=Edhazardia aedis (strain USNM 41457) TaxID=1003232 RepID=J9DA45_EDHAE|nr:hypothetical protein EDEG_01180 [Edhazardia aedis USNM 41457]|eukprot:EJW04596.1 hypothetical protein EDEG_01180 [Edhazardia aedis USNM 41457]